jgi:hypothetical protein
MLPLFIDQFFKQLFQGNVIAYLALALAVGFIVVLCVLGVLYWKLPQLAKSQLWNNILGCKPTFATCYPDLTVKFKNPTLFSNGIAYDGHWQILLQDDGSGNLSIKERDVINKVYRMEGTNSPFYLRWSKQAYVVSPELAALAQHGTAVKALAEMSETTAAQLLEKLRSADYKHPIKVKRTELITTLQGIKDEFIPLAPMHFTFDVDMPKIKEFIPNAVSDTNLKEHENTVRQENEHNMAKADMVKVVAALSGIGILVSVVTLLKVMNIF